MVGGGVRGKDVGIAHSTTTQGGATIKAFHLFMEGYPQAGGMTTGIIVGEGIGGTTNEYLTNKFNKTGGAGNRLSIGRSKIRGVSKGCETERGHNNNIRKRGHHLERINHSAHSTNREPMKKRT